MNNINYWFSSDWHLSHNKIIKLAKRPFNTVEEMNKRIYNSYIQIMKPGDHFYFLGDMAWDMEAIEYFFFKVYKKNHHFFWILGNHDLKFKNKILKMLQYKQNIHIYNGLLDIEIKEDKDRYPITLCHYPMITWNKSHYGAWQLYGHHHHDYSGEYKYVKDHALCMGKQFNVAVDLHNFAPLHFERIKNQMSHLSDNWDIIRR